MNDGLIPQRYAKALYKFAEESGNNKRVYDVMKNVVLSFEANPELQKVLANPYIDKSEKRNLLIAAAGVDREESYENFVQLLIDNKRESFAYSTALAYLRLYMKANNISDVEIVTAVAMGENELEKLRQLVRNSYEGRTFEFRYSVNPDIIGGFIITIDSVRMDASISNELEQLRLNLLSRN